MGIKAKISAVVFVILALSCNSLQATLITIEIAAEIAEVYDISGLLEGNVNVGDTITGSYTYDSTTPDSNPLETVGDYWHFSSPYGISLSVGGFVFQTDPDNVNFLVSVGNNHLGDDNYLLRSYYNLPLSNGVWVEHISWHLVDYSATALSSTDLPTTPPVLEDWESIGGITIRYGPKGSSMIRAHVDSAVPEPGTVFLLGLGSLTLIRRRKFAAGRS